MLYSIYSIYIIHYTIYNIYTYTLYTKYIPSLQERDAARRSPSRQQQIRSVRVLRLLLPAQTSLMRALSLCGASIGF